MDGLQQVNLLGQNVERNSVTGHLTEFFFDQSLGLSFWKQSEQMHHQQSQATDTIYLFVVCFPYIITAFVALKFLPSVSRCLDTHL